MLNRILQRFFLCASRTLNTPHLSKKYLQYLYWIVCCLPLSAFAAPHVIHWQLNVLRDGKVIDTYERTSNIGQTMILTDTHPSIPPDQASTRISISPFFATDQAIHFEIQFRQNFPTKTPNTKHTIRAFYPNLIVPIKASQTRLIFNRDSQLSLQIHVLSAN